MDEEIWTYTYYNVSSLFHNIRLLYFGGPSGARTQDTLIKSQVLYQLS